jgi:Mg2+ and Co2+ transporter CorA
MYTALQEARKLQTDDHELLEWRNMAYDILRRVELLQNDVKTALDFEVARQSELQAETSHQMATSAHRLNVLAAFFFPLATLAAVLGANLQNVLPGVSHRTSLLIMLTIGLLLGGGLTYLVTRPAFRPGKEPDDRNGR